MAGDVSPEQLARHLYGRPGRFIPVQGPPREDLSDLLTHIDPIDTPLVRGEFTPVFAPRSERAEHMAAIWARDLAVVTSSQQIHVYNSPYGQIQVKRSSQVSDFEGRSHGPLILELLDGRLVTEDELNNEAEMLANLGINVWQLGRSVFDGIHE